ncbi:2Fe-2S iron-sulfur cluster-binding protein [Aromatoleum aromaticum]|uniref:2Fe-2S iron-sulfur cluster-binding protein n=1 Tax=Aromatoleum aromaticum TaxID=551760 RepID=UPI0014599CE9|nr:2Fe-2S iron-sulfur cluster binding domain-containing protein [Aromatoleum aromaticum]NMG55528.1 2Fe-2S iron-sulfur cluster binding domain-containing protein [Aromatoleum aromaticum]
MTTSFDITVANAEASFNCAGNDTVLRAGLRAGFGLAYECNTGACGSCKFDLLEGEVHDLFPEATGLRQKERERGKRLACQCVPLSPCRIKMHTGAQYVSAIRPARFPVRFVEWRQITLDIAVITFRGEPPAAFIPGQYAMLSLGEPRMTRAYSMSNTPNDEGVWEFIIREVAGGAVSPQFQSLESGAEIELDGPYGVAYFRADAQRPVVGIAGGSGLAPVLSIMRGAAQAGGFTQDTFVFYGGRGPADIPDVLGMLDPNDKRTRFFPAVSMPELTHGWTGDVGFIHEFLPRKLDRPLDEYEYYLAGPPPMIESAVRLLAADHKVPMAQIHFDRFF